jgi:bifunctional DNase/RNase
MIPVTVNAVAVLAEYGIALLLKETTGNRVLPIFIGPLEASAIDSHLKGELPARPLTHDLVVTLINNLHADLLRVEIWKVENETFFAKLILSQRQVDLDGAQTTTVEIDARPSDAVGIALRGNVPLFVDEQLMNQEGKIFQVESGTLDDPSLTLDLDALLQTPPGNNTSINLPIPEAILLPETTENELLPPDLVALKVRLNTAIKEEHYEEAARLRDTITNLEKKSEAS